MRGQAMRGVIVALGVAVGSACAACGGTRAVAVDEVSHPPPARSAEVGVRAEPLQVSVNAERVGESLRLDVKGIGRGRREGEAFEDPLRWQVRVMLDGAELQRLVNGPVRVDRSPVGGARGTQWDTIVRFSVVFKLPAAARAVDVVVEPPESEPVATTVTLAI